MGLFKKSELAKNYKVGEQLGSGNFAVVKKAEKIKKDDSDKNIPKYVAVKIIDKAKVEDMGDIKREIEIMEKVNHKNVINLYEIYDEPKKMNLVMELVTGGELFDRIVAKSSYTEREAADLMITLTDALAYLHDLKIVHRDLKPENLLYASEADDAEIKIADFGLARVVSGGDMMKTACGTPGYVAPEILKNQGYDSGAVDVWSVGVILYILLCGFPPFYEEELPALFDQILHARFDFPSPWWDSISQDAKDLVMAMLTIDPKKRIAAVEVRNHKWIKSASSETALSATQKSLRKYNASRKLKKAAMGVIAQNKIAKAIGDLKIQNN
mmetsp:Transcript_18708/g.40335  ORF Transcript_18708/g.40335 Transcript_18708/m.40335 type:complete len:327 (-) Transcript_18708:152-1132(-)